MGLRIFSGQIKDLKTGASIITAGGALSVCKAGLPDLASLFNPTTGAAIANPVPLVRGGFSFGISDVDDTVDLYGFAPKGHFLSFESVKAQALVEFTVNTQQRDQVAKIPFSVADSAATVEEDTGLDLPVDSIVLPTPAILVTAIDATETLDVGTLSTEAGGDPNGFLAAVALGVLGAVKGSLISTGQTLGALLAADESGAGVLVPESHVVVSTTRSISYTSTAGSDTYKGYILLPYRLLGDIE